jgi:hypothetical protein
MSGNGLIGRKRSPVVMRGMHGLFDSVKKPRFDTHSYADIDESLKNMHRSMLATGVGAVGGSGIGADYMPQPPHLLQNSAHAPILGGSNPLDQQHAYTAPKFSRESLEMMQRAVNDMRSTVYEMPHPSSHGIHQHQRGLDAMPPALAIPTTHAYTTNMGIGQMPSPRNSVSPPAAVSTHPINHSPTPSLSPPSRHSPVNQHAMPRVPLYPQVSTSSDMFPSQAPPATLGASYDHGRRFSGGTLQSARVVLPLRPRDETTVEETVEENADESDDFNSDDDDERGKSLEQKKSRTKDGNTSDQEASSSPGESTTLPNVRAQCATALAYDRWLNTMRLLEIVQQHIQELLETGEYVAEPKKVEDRLPPRSSPVPEPKAKAPLYPQLNI